MGLNLPFGIKPISAIANVDERYGTYTSKSLALAATAGTRKLGLTVGIIENSEVVEYWFKAGITDLDLVSKFPTTEIIDTSTAEVWDIDKPYEAGNVYVSYVNINSGNVLFHTESLYRCRVSTLEGTSPEDSLYDEITNPTGSWVYQGSQVIIASSSTSTIVVQSTTNLKAITGYKPDHNVSVIDTNLTYKFDALNESGLKPNDNGAGSWVAFTTFHPGHIIKDASTTFPDKLNLKFIGNVNVSNDSENTIVNIGWNIIQIDSAVTTSFNAVNNTIYIVDCTTAPVLAILPNAIIGDNSSYRFILKSDPHKLTISTVGGVQLIEGYTSQIIPTVKGDLLIDCNGTGYNIISDGRRTVNIVEITESRNFSTDGFENDVIYYCIPNENDITLTLPTATILAGNITIKARFEQYGPGRTIIQAVSGNIGNTQTQIISEDAQGFDIIWKGAEYLLQNDTRPKILTTSYTTYPVSEDSTIIDSVTGTYFKQRVSTIEDSRFDSVTEVVLTTTITANPTDPYQLIGSSISDVGVLNGLIPEGALNIFWNLSKTGNTNINIQVKYYLRNELDAETLIASSSVGLVNNVVQMQYILSTTHLEFMMSSTDKLVMRYYARKNTTGTDPVLNVGYEGPNPSRSVLEVSTGTISHNQMPGRDLFGAHKASAIELDSGESIEVKINKLYTESTVSPVDPNVGDEWLYTTTGILYKWYGDTDGSGAWISWYKN